MPATNPTILICALHDSFPKWHILNLRCALISVCIHKAKPFEIKQPKDNNQRLQIGQSGEQQTIAKSQNRLLGVSAHWTRSPLQPNEKHRVTFPTSIAGQCRVSADEANMIKAQRDSIRRILPWNTKRTHTHTPTETSEKGENLFSGNAVSINASPTKETQVAKKKQKSFNVCCQKLIPVMQGCFAWISFIFISKRFLLKMGEVHQFYTQTLLTNESERQKLREKWKRLKNN